jgi:hypothetical protein
MKICVFFATVNKTISARTLHSITNLNLICIKNNIHSNLNFIEKGSTIPLFIEKNVKNYDRIIFIDYGVSIDVPSIVKLLSDFPKNHPCMVLPCVTEGVDWPMFCEKVKNESQEPNYQKGMKFDTDVGELLEDGVRSVNHTLPKVWAFDTANVMKKFKGNFKISDNMFTQFKQKKIKICAYTKSSTTVTYAHECIGNILENSDFTKVEL